MLAAESHGPGVYGVMAKRLQEQYGLSDEAVAFWSVHDVADEDHSGIGRELLEEFAHEEADFQLVLQVVRETIDMMNLLTADTWRVMQEAA